MFNLKAFSTVNIHDLIHKELNVLGVRIHGPNNIDIDIKSEQSIASSIDEAIQLLQEEEKEIKRASWEQWQDLNHVADVILENTGGNDANLNNIVFLSSLKRSVFMSNRFSQLKEVHQKLVELMNIDVGDAHSELIHKFNIIFLQIISNHVKLLSTKYKIQLLSKVSNKVAEVDGPWANTDLSIEERVQDWDKYYSSDMHDSTKWKQRQTRYNPEYDPVMGVFFNYQDLNRDPYLFDERDDESPYPVSSSADIV